jgi:hypothetical protein
MKQKQKELVPGLIPASAIARVQDYLSKALNELQPYGVSLTPQERMSALKMGNKSILFVGSSNDEALQHAEVTPPDLKMQESKVDFQNSLALSSLAVQAKQLQHLISDTQLSYGSRAFKSALYFYAAVGSAAKRGVLGAKAISLKLKALHPYGAGGRRKAPPSLLKGPAPELGAPLSL